MVPLTVLKRRKTSNSIEDLKCLRMYQAFPCEIWCYDQIPVWTGIGGNTSIAYPQMIRIGLFTLFSFQLKHFFSSFSHLTLNSLFDYDHFFFNLLRCKIPTVSCWWPCQFSVFLIVNPTLLLHLVGVVGERSLLNRGLLVQGYS